MIMDRQISTERFIIKGLYIAITVAVYGVIDREVPQHYPQKIAPHHTHEIKVKQEPTAQPSIQPVSQRVQSHDGMWVYKIFSIQKSC